MKIKFPMRMAKAHAADILNDPAHCTICFKVSGSSSLKLLL